MSFRVEYIIIILIIVVVVVRIGIVRLGFLFVRTGKIAEHGEQTARGSITTVTTTAARLLLSWLRCRFTARLLFLLLWWQLPRIVVVKLKVAQRYVETSRALESVSRADQ